MLLRHRETELFSCYEFGTQSCPAGWPGVVGRKLCLTEYFLDTCRDWEENLARNGISSEVDRLLAPRLTLAVECTSRFYVTISEVLCRKIQKFVAYALTALSLKVTTQQD